MGQAIVKFNHEGRDWYLIWSTVVDAPVTCAMTREELEDHVRHWDGQRAAEALPARLERCDKYGHCFVDYDRGGAEGVVRCNRAGAEETSLTPEQVWELSVRRRDKPSATAEGIHWDQMCDMCLADIGYRSGDDEPLCDSCRARREAT